MSKKIYTSQEFDTFKENVLSQKITRKKVSLGEIQIITEGVAKYAGLTFRLDPAAFTSLLAVLGISKSLRGKLIKDFGINFAEKLIEIMSSKSSGVKAELVMLVDVKSKTILNFLRSDTAMISNTTYFNEVTNIIDKYGLDISGLHSRNNGGFSVSTLAPGSEWGMKGFNDEVFKFGLNFENDPIKGTVLSPFNQRLVCTNGMVTTDMLGASKIINTRDSWENFFSTINSFNSSGFRPMDFDKSIKDTMKVQASVAELEYARNIIKSNSAFDDTSLELYMPYRETQLAYAKKNLDITMFNPEQKKNAESATSYYDLINEMTYISSNVTGMGVRNSDKIQMAAGKMLSKVPNTSNIVNSPFKK